MSQLLLKLNVWNVLNDKNGDIAKFYKNLEEAKNRSSNIHIVKINKKELLLVGYYKNYIIPKFCIFKIAKEKPVQKR